MNDIFFMEEAMKEARKAYLKDETPIGAIIVRNGEIIAKAHNLVEEKKDLIESNETDIPKPVIGAPVFSSVYAPKKEEPVIDLTSVTSKKEEVVEETKKEEVPTVATFNSIMGETYDVKE